MNKLFEDKLATLAEDEHMLGAIRAVVEDKIKKSSPDIDKTNDDKILGQKFRASEEAKKLLEGALEEISSYKTQRSGNNKKNKGR